MNTNEIMVELIVRTQRLTGIVGDIRKYLRSRDPDYMRDHLSVDLEPLIGELANLQTEAKSLLDQG